MLTEEKKVNKEKKILPSKKKQGKEAKNEFYKELNYIAFKTSFERLNSFYQVEKKNKPKMASRLMLLPNKFFDLL